MTEVQSLTPRVLTPLVDLLHAETDKQKVNKNKGSIDSVRPTDSDQKISPTTFLLHICYGGVGSRSAHSTMETPSTALNFL